MKKPTLVVGAVFGMLLSIPTSGTAQGAGCGNCTYCGPGMTYLYPESPYTPFQGPYGGCYVGFCQQWWPCTSEDAFRALTDEEISNLELLVTEGNVARLGALLPEIDDVAFYNPIRNHIQVLGCDGAVLISRPLIKDDDVRALVAEVLRRTSELSVDH
jgi:hypothetical protein